LKPATKIPRPTAKKKKVLTENKPTQKRHKQQHRAPRQPKKKEKASERTSKAKQKPPNTRQDTERIGEKMFASLNVAS
jgi:hypothetical protein